jgi:Na+/phosphate symporter
LNQFAAVVLFVLWTLAFVFGVYVISTGRAKGFGYFLAVWLAPFAIAGTLALLIGLDHSY